MRLQWDRPDESLLWTMLTYSPLLVTTYALIWLLFRFLSLCAAWVRRERILSAIKLGPSQLAVLKALFSVQLHREVLEKTRKYGEIFYARLLTVHVRSPTPLNGAKGLVELSVTSHEALLCWTWQLL